MINTIILKMGQARLTRPEQKKFVHGDTIWGTDSSPEEIGRWSIEQKEEAKAELEKFQCVYEDNGPLFNVTEYALEFCELDEHGEFVSGSDFDLAPSNLGI